MPVAVRARNCEFLNKLDLTVNFVDLDTFEESVTHLASLHALRELFLMGNPCTEWEQHRAYVHRRPAQRCARAHAAFGVGADPRAPRAAIAGMWWRDARRSRRLTVRR